MNSVKEKEVLESPPAPPIDLIHAARPGSLIAYCGKRCTKVYGLASQFDVSCETCRMKLRSVKGNG
jgi:hypothetical protein